MARSMPFKMKLLAEFPECADLGIKIYEHFGNKRNNKGLGREWFHVEPGEAVRLIGSLMGSSCGTVTKNAVSDVTGREIDMKRVKPVPVGTTEAVARFGEHNDRL